ncbi:MAG: alpha/beta hydrolase [Alphaproteobacteria bacterium]|nr:alpha/beta hydrolase [Alphaproteobacteria bacterium]
MLKKIVLALASVAFLPALFLASIFLMPITFTQTVDQNRDLPSVVLNNYKFHAETMGDESKPVIIALHGGPGGDYRNLLPIAPLADDYHLVFYDQRMTGLSSREWDGTLDLQIFFDDLDAFVDHYGKGRKVILLGHSWGAMMASGYVGMHPEKVEKAILIEPGIMRPDLAEEYFDSQSGPGLDAYPSLAWIWINSWRVDTGHDQYAREDFVLSNAYFHMPGKGVHCGNAIPANFEGWRASRKTLDETVMAYVHDPELLKQLDFITDAHLFDGEVLFLASSCNTVYGADYQQRHLPFFQHARLETVENSGHFIFYDQPENAIALVREFLRE